MVTLLVVLGGLSLALHSVTLLAVLGIIRWTDDETHAAYGFRADVLPEPDEPEC